MSLTFEEKKNKSRKVFNLITEAFWSSWYSWLVHDSFLFVFFCFCLQSLILPFVHLLQKRVGVHLT